MCNSPYTMCMCCMYINAGQTLDIRYTTRKKVCYKPVTKCTYLPVLDSFNNWNIIKYSQKSTSYDTFNEIHQGVIDGISDNTASLFESVKYCAINTTDTSTNGLYCSIPCIFKLLEVAP